MKYIPLALTFVLTLFFVTIASSQCSMGSGNSHNHGTGKDASHEQHNEKKISKGYASINDDGIQEATIVIKNGYQPDTLVVKKNIPLKLVFDLEEDNCTGTVVFKDFDIKEKLEPYQLTSIEFTPAASGEFAFSCPMHMINGTLIVKE